MTQDQTDRAPEPDVAYCAHLSVSYKPIDNPDGSKTERWLCDYDCGATFAPSKRFEATIERLQGEKEHAEDWAQQTNTHHSGARKRIEELAAQLSSLTEERDALKRQNDALQAHHPHAYHHDMMMVAKAEAKVSALTEELTQAKEQLRATELERGRWKESSGQNDASAQKAYSDLTQVRAERDEFQRRNETVAKALALLMSWAADKDIPVPQAVGDALLRRAEREAEQWLT